MGAGFSRFRNPNFSLSYNQGWTQPDGGKLGLRGVQYDLFPTIQFSQGYTRLGDDIASDNYFTTLAFLDNLTWVKGKHTLKFGFETQVHRDNFRNYGAGGGSFNFSQLETAMPGVSNSGSPIASWLLGAVDSGNSYFRDSLPGGRYKYYGWFVDDTFKVMPKLTLNLGMRYEIQTPTADPLGPPVLHGSQRGESRCGRPARRLCVRGRRKRTPGLDAVVRHALQELRASNRLRLQPPEEHCGSRRLRDLF
jgi:outer membrane receptor protein involved in Fe transport